MEENLLDWSEPGGSEMVLRAGDGRRGCSGQNNESNTRGLKGAGRTGGAA